MKPSERFTLNNQDWQKWGKNVLVFASPILILILTELQNGKTLEELKPLVYAVVIQALIDLFKKFISGK